MLTVLSPIHTNSSHPPTFSPAGQDRPWVTEEGQGRRPGRGFRLEKRPALPCGGRAEGEGACAGRAQHRDRGWLRGTGVAAVGPWRQSAAGQEEEKVEPRRKA